MNSFLNRWLEIREDEDQWIPVKVVGVDSDLVGGFLYRVVWGDGRIGWIPPESLGTAIECPPERQPKLSEPEGPLKGKRRSTLTVLKT